MKYFEITIKKEDTGESEDLVFQISFPSMKVRWFGYVLVYEEWKNIVKHNKKLKTETIDFLDEIINGMARDINIEILMNEKD
jgi:hypothetical protein